MIRFLNLLRKHSKRIGAVCLACAFVLMSVLLPAFSVEQSKAEGTTDNPISKEYGNMLPFGGAYVSTASNGSFLEYNIPPYLSSANADNYDFFESSFSLDGFGIYDSFVEFDFGAEDFYYQLEFDSDSVSAPSDVDGGYMFFQLRDTVLEYSVFLDMMSNVTFSFYGSNMNYCRSHGALSVYNSSGDLVTYEPRVIERLQNQRLAMRDMLPVLDDVPISHVFESSGDTRSYVVIEELLIDVSLIDPSVSVDFVSDAWVLEYSPSVFWTYEDYLTSMEYFYGSVLPPVYVEVAPMDMIAHAVESFFNIELFPGFSLYTFIMVAVGSVIFWYVLKMFLGG